MLAAAHSMRMQGEKGYNLDCIQKVVYTCPDRFA